LLIAVPAIRAADATVRGRLTDAGGKPALQLKDGKLIQLTGGEDTMGVLKDKRLAGVDFEAVGTESAGIFTVNPIHKRAMFVHKDGKRLSVTYWCTVCAIRTYTPGLCWCCRAETALDLLEADKVG
jgi:hypothetical protein